MPKYILIGLGILLIVFLTIYLWSKLSEVAKNRTIASFLFISISADLWILKSAKQA